MGLAIWRTGRYVDMAATTFAGVSSGGSGGVDDTTLTVYGASNLNFDTPTNRRLVICGIDAGLHTIAVDGSIAFTYGSDPGGILTAAYLVANQSGGLYPTTDHDATFTVHSGGADHTTTVPILVGLDYTVQGQLIRPLTEPIVQAGPGAGLGKSRRGVWGALLVRDCLGIQLGTSLSNLYTVGLTTDGGLTPELAIAADAPYTGVVLQELDDDVSFDGQLTWQSNGPSPMIIGGAAIFFEGESR